MKHMSSTLRTWVFVTLSILMAFIPVLINALDDFRAGDLVKSPGNPAVYYYGYDGKRHAFPNEQTFFSWYQDFKRVKVISRNTLESLPLGKNVVIRPGTYLVKFHNSNRVYAVEPLGRLRHILNGQLARELYGPAWGHKIAHLPEHLFSDYSLAGILAEKKHPTGTIFKYNGDSNYYLVTNNYSRRIASVAKWENYRFNDYFVQRVDKDRINYIPGFDIINYRASISDTAQTLVEEEINDYLYYVKIDPGHTIRAPRKEGSGLTARYYYNDSLSGEYVKRTDKKIDFNWDWDPPFEGMSQDFSVEWTGKIQIPDTGTIDFYAYSDDGVKVYIDDVLVIDNWVDQKAAWSHGRVRTTSGLHDIKVQYYDSGYDAIMKLAWEEKGKIIPETYLFPEGTK